jgi:hypothetical protein
MTLDTTVPRMKTTYGMYALLIAANLFMGMTVVTQSRVIENQRVLIKTLFFDVAHNARVHVKEAVARR